MNNENKSIKTYIIITLIIILVIMLFFYNGKISELEYTINIQNETKQEEYDKLNDTIKNYEKEIEDLNTEIKSYESEIKRLEDNIEELKEPVSDDNFDYTFKNY